MSLVFPDLEAWRRVFVGGHDMGLPARMRVLVAPLAVLVALAAAVTAAAPGFVHIRVNRGDTLTAIAARHHTTIKELVALNHLPGNGNLIYAGQTLAVPAPPQPAGPTTVVTEVRHKVVSGDTLIGIAQRYHVSTASIAARNHLPRSLVVMLGTTLVIPVPHQVSATTPPQRHYPAAVTAAAAQHRAEMARRSVPSHAQMRNIIAATARQLGVDPALALAVSWQEAGFNQRMVSAADAIGAMQVVPSTGNFVSRYVVGRQLDLLNAHDNALAGVALLRQLLRAAPVGQAVAGYYQGLASVQSRGMYADTKAYVANVLALRERFKGYR